MPKKYMYRDFDDFGKKLIRKLRRHPDAVIFYPSSFDIDSVISYLRQRGYKANPKLDTTAQYWTDKMIDEVNSSDILLGRIMKSKDKWD